LFSTSNAVHTIPELCVLARAERKTSSVHSSGCLLPLRGGEGGGGGGGGGGCGGSDDDDDDLMTGSEDMS
jgi:hypothetical protein